ncbi:MAG: hypothetical protein PHW41_10615 [Eubacteriales bacterium]|nr:hypothetical protein [Eubacteriales bacterium]
MYDLIRVLIAIVFASPIILIPVFRHTFRNRRSFFIVSACGAALILGVLLFQWPFENEFGGFATAEQAIDYQYGKADFVYTIESENSAFVLSNRTSDVLHKENGRFYLVSPMYTSRENALSDSISASIRGDQRTLERFVQVTMAQTDRNPATIMDNKGTVFETAFTYNGLTYYVGTYQEDGLSYALYVDGMEVELMTLR